MTSINATKAQRPGGAPTLLVALIVILLTATQAPGATPVVDSISPTQATAAAGLTATVTVNGSSFESGAVVLVNSQAITATFVNSTKLMVNLPRGNGGQFDISVRNPGNEESVDSATFLVKTIAPTLTSVSPSTVTVGGPAFTLTATGSDFANSSLLQWNGETRTTHVISATQITADIPASDIATGPSAEVTIDTSPAGGGPGGTSAAKTVTIQPPQPPTVTSLMPSSAFAGGPAFTLTVNGGNFVDGSSRVRWNGSNRDTTFVNSTKLTAQIAQADIAAVTTASVTVFDTTTGLTSSPATSFPVNTPLTPAITTLTPNSAISGSGAFVLTVDGSNFVTNSVVRWNGASRTTTFVNVTRLTASIPASDLVTSGTPQVTVFTPLGSLTSNALTFTVTSTAPTISSVLPATVTAGGPAFTLTVNGSNFVNGNSVVRWEGSNRATTFVTTGQLTAQILQTDIATAAMASVTVLDTSSGLVSNAGTVTVNNPTPVATTLLPASAVVGGGQFTLTVNGSGFVNGSQVRWNGESRPTTFVNAGQLTATIPASDISHPGSAAVTVFSASPGGGTSNALAFAINNPAPNLTGIDPSSAPAGSQPFTLRTTGTDFVGSSVILFGRVPLQTTAVSGAELTATVPANLIMDAGTIPVTVMTPGPGGGESGPLQFQVVGADPTPPNTTIISGPSGAITNASTVTFTWTGTDNATPPANLVYAFRLDPLEPAFSSFAPVTTKTYDLPNGNYTFFVKARDQAGNEDPTPDSRAFSIDTPPPPLAAAVLPSSRSVQIGTPATAFVTIINAGTSTAFGVGIGLSGAAAAQSTLERTAAAVAPPVDLTFQTTDPHTNAVVGTPNTPVDIPASQAQTYVVGLAPRTAFPPTDIVFTFAGTNTSPVLTIPGVNTLAMSASAIPVPDIIALALTITGDGIVHVPGAHATGAFAVASINAGASATITVSADTGSATLPVTILLCRTNAAAQCVSPVVPAPTVTTQINANETPTFSVFVTATGSVPFDPAANRIVVRFKDDGGIDRGSTSVAVTTE